MELCITFTGFPTQHNTFPTVDIRAVAQIGQWRVYDKKITDLLNSSLTHVKLEMYSLYSFCNKKKKTARTESIIFTDISVNPKTKPNAVEKNQNMVKHL